MTVEEEIEDFDDVVDDETETAVDLAELKKAVEKRIEGTKYQIQELTDFEDEKYFEIGFPNGRKTRWVSCSRPDTVERLLSVPFESYVFLGDLEAIASFYASRIEARVKVVNPYSLRLIRRNLLPLEDEQQEVEEFEQPPGYGRIRLECDEEGSSVSVQLGAASDDLAAIVRWPGLMRQSRLLSLTISGLSVNRHDHALNLLKKIANSFFFQVDLTTGIALSLSQDRKIYRRPARKRPSGDGKDLRFPQMEYDDAPMSLYWYARSASGMPLLQFLAYYQVIEFYFYSYSREDARKRLRRILKDPSFRLDRDADIAKLLSSVDSRGRGYGDERSQFRLTLSACVELDELRSFLEEDEERREFFSNKQKGLTNHKLSLANRDHDLRNDTADLLYDIRCRIVHTKGESSEGHMELLLPFSPESELLAHDIELLQFIARKVLVSASTTIRL